jgi:hypothetical protein
MAAKQRLRVTRLDCAAAPPSVVGRFADIEFIAAHRDSLSLGLIAVSLKRQLSQ